MESLIEFIQTLGLNEIITPDDLAILDQHHLGGLSATKRVFEHLSPSSKMSILDIGSGWGGPARTLCHIYDCNVTGLDISENNIKNAKYLSQISNLDKKTLFQIGSAEKFTFDTPFDAAYMLHVSMCIKNKASLIKSCYDTLKPTALLAIYDVFLNEDETCLPYPLPWADEEQHSFPETVERMLSRLKDHGFEILKHENGAENAKNKAKKALSYIETHDIAAKATKLHLGENYHQKMSNIKAALLANLCAPHMIIAIKK
jgi:cyclopropane fatty-acyl-phospholipid synthase-like methyltransferase